MSTRHDNFFDTSAENGFYLSDAWIVQGGQFAIIEWSSDTPITNGNVWSKNLDSIQFESTSTNFIGTVDCVTHEDNRNGSSVVRVMIKLPRIIDRDETVTIPTLSGDRVVANVSTTQKVRLPSEIITIRNYSNVSFAGTLDVPLRSGSSPYLKKTNPSADPDLQFNISTEGGSFIFNGISLTTKRGSLSAISTDSDFNNQDSYQTSGNWIGEIDGFTGFGTTFTILFAVRLENQAGFYYSKVEQIDPSDGGGLTELDIDPIHTPEFLAVLNPGSNTQSTFSVEDYIGSLENSGNGVHRIYNGIFSGITPNQATRAGNIKNRTLVYAIQSDGTNVKIFGCGGKKMLEESAVVINPTLANNEYLAFRADGSVKFSEILYIDRAISDVEMQEYLCLMDDTYGTTSKEFYVDLDSGNDTTGNGTISTPYLTIEKAVDECCPTFGDQILVACGTDANLTSEIIISSNTGDSDESVPFGYSPDYPFTIKAYGLRSSGRPVLNFTSDVPYYIINSLQNENMLISGLNMRSPERDINDISFAGQQSLKGESDGFGVFFNPTGNNISDAVSTSLVVYDCEIKNTLRHGIVITNGENSVHNAYKYSAVGRTIIHDLYNMNYPSQNQNHTFGASDYGIAGLFSEKNCGLCVQGSIFSRVGWSPDLILDAGISVGSVAYNATENALFSVGFATYFSSYDSWSGASTENHNMQRVDITHIGGSPVDDVAFISAGILNVGSSFGIYLKTTPSVAVDGDDCNINVLDPLPRCSGNVDVLIGENAYGSNILFNNIFQESSSYNIVSSQSYIASENTSSNNQFGFVASPRYTKITNNFFGGTVGSGIIRKQANTNSNGTLVVGGMTLADRIYNHGWDIKTIEDSPILHLNISGNIFAREESYGFSQNILDIPTSSAIYFDRNIDGSINATINNNTMYSIPGVAVAIYTEETPTSSASITFTKNLVDQNNEYTDPPTPNYVYSFKDPHSLQNNVVWSAMSFGGENNKGIYNIKSVSTPQSDGFCLGLANIIGQTGYDIGYNTWKNIIFNGGNNPSPDEGVWTDVTFATVGRSLATYNSEVMAGSTSAREFISSAIVDHDNGWNIAIESEDILEYIREGWTPINLDQADYNNDYVGAVPFVFTAPTSTFKPYFGVGTDTFGFGKGN